MEKPAIAKEGRRAVLKKQSLAIFTARGTTPHA
ncbi:hypothetical protein Tco_1269692, partial [Tanacetum coccineum]